MNGLGAVRAAASAAAGGVPADRLSLLSPVTTPCRVVAQAVNYRGHAQESGFGDSPPAVFFRKSSASVSGPTDDVVRPGHVRLLDYELELGLVMGRRLAIGGHRDRRGAAGLCRRRGHVQRRQRPRRPAGEGPVL
jgi:2-keto-4-pentenoate hydratase/2-oxohepta-3-ene-1,7-dioic acid hydratase in catechol pathway